MFTKSRSKILAFLNKYAFSRFLINLQKSFEEDNGSNKVAYITYFMFLSALPLLLLSLTLFDIIFASNSSVRKTLIESTFSSIPVAGDTLESNINFVEGKGITLVITVFILVIATRAGALALKDALSQIFEIDLKEKSFISKQFSAFVALVIISIGIVVPTIFQSILQGNDLMNFFLFVVNIVWNSLFIYLLFWELVGKAKAKGFGPLAGGIALSAIQLISVLFLRNSLDNQRPLYGALAVVLVFIAWIALQVRVLIYSAEINKLNSKA